MYLAINEVESPSVMLITPVVKIIGNCHLSMLVACVG
jgi:hypothetical protein